MKTGPTSTRRLLEPCRIFPCVILSHFAKQRNHYTDIFMYYVSDTVCVCRHVAASRTHVFIPTDIHTFVQLDYVLLK